MTAGKVGAPAPTILAVDPGPAESGYVIYNDRIVRHGKIPNERLLAGISKVGAEYLVIEQIRGYGMRVGNETFDACVWCGRFGERFGWSLTHWLPRKTIVTALCNTATAGDTEIRAALAYRYGSADVKSAKGTAKKPGPLYGFANDEWSALAVAVVWQDMRAGGRVQL